jgi:hypothetical protein
MWLWVGEGGVVTVMVAVVAPVMVMMVVARVMNGSTSLVGGGHRNGGVADRKGGRCVDDGHGAGDGAGNGGSVGPSPCHALPMLIVGMLITLGSKHALVH